MQPQKADTLLHQAWARQRRGHWAYQTGGGFHGVIRWSCAHPPSTSPLGLVASLIVPEDWMKPSIRHWVLDRVALASVPGASCHEGDCTMGVPPLVRPAAWAIVAACGGHGGPTHCDPPTSAKPIKI